MRNMGKAGETELQALDDGGMLEILLRLVATEADVAARRRSDEACRVALQMVTGIGSGR